MAKNKNGANLVCENQLWSAMVKEIFEVKYG
jgi:hypothetical protein